MPISLGPIATILLYQKPFYISPCPWLEDNDLVYTTDSNTLYRHLLEQSVMRWVFTAWQTECWAY